MFLSNLLKFFLLTCFFVPFLQACSSSAGNENRPVSLNIESKSEFPFSTKEPEVYQGDFVVTTAGTEKKWFIARKNEMSRFDRFDGNNLVTTELITDKVYEIDHQRKVYMEIAGNLGGSVSDLGLDTFFRGKEFREFDDLGTERNLKKFRVRSEPAGGEVFIYIDPAIGMIVKQEFTSKSDAMPSVEFTYEIRNPKLDVDDGIFQLPAGYRKVSLSEYRANKNK